jgi:hypothetical protein
VKSIDARDRSFVVPMTRPRGGPLEVLVRYEPETRFLKDRDAGTAADLKRGLAVTVAGRGSPERGVYAEQVTIHTRGVGRARSTMGVVTSVDAENHHFILSVTGPDRQPIQVTIQTDDKTRYRAGRTEAAFGDLAPGKRVLVQGDGNPQQRVIAYEVMLLPAVAPGQPPRRGR